jgi:paraquat-inducible protein A
MSGSANLQPLLVACPDCDLLNQVPELAPGESASCVRCEVTLSRNPVDSIRRGIALTWTAIILYVIALAFPFLSFGKAGIVAHTHLITGIVGLYNQGMYFLAAAVSFTIVIVPIFMLCSLCYLLLPLQAGLRLPGAARVLRWLLHLQPWNMVEIFMIGIIVAAVKLHKMATLEPGIAAWAVLTLMFVLTFISASLEPRLLWERLEAARCLGLKSR